MKCIDHYMLKRFCYSCSPFVFISQWGAETVYSFYCCMCAQEKKVDKK